MPDGGRQAPERSLRCRLPPPRCVNRLQLRTACCQHPSWWSLRQVAPLQHMSYCVPLPRRAKLLGLAQLQLIHTCAIELEGSTQPPSSYACAMGPPPAGHLSQMPGQHHARLMDPSANMTSCPLLESVSRHQHLQGPSLADLVSRCQDPTSSVERRCVLSCSAAGSAGDL